MCPNHLKAFPPVANAAAFRISVRQRTCFFRGGARRPVKPAKLKKKQQTMFREVADLVRPDVLLEGYEDVAFEGCCLERPISLGFPDAPILLPAFCASLPPSPSCSLKAIRQSTSLSPSPALSPRTYPSTSTLEVANCSDDRDTYASTVPTSVSASPKSYSKPPSEASVFSQVPPSPPQSYSCTTVASSSGEPGSSSSNSSFWEDRSSEEAEPLTTLTLCPTFSTKCAAASADLPPTQVSYREELTTSFSASGFTAQDQVTETGTTPTLQAATEFTATCSQSSDARHGSSCTSRATLISTSLSFREGRAVPNTHEDEIEKCTETEGLKKEARYTISIERTAEEWSRTEQQLYLPQQVLRASWTLSSFTSVPNWHDATNLTHGALASASSNSSSEFLLLAQGLLGKWETILERSDSLEPLFKRLGVAYVKRLIVDRLAVPLTITLKDKVLHMVVHLPIGNRQMRWALDGSTTTEEDPDCGSWQGTVRCVDLEVPKRALAHLHSGGDTRKEVGRRARLCSLEEGQRCRTLQQVRSHPKIGVVYETRAVLPDAKHGKILYLNYTLLPKSDTNTRIEVVRILRPVK